MQQLWRLGCQLAGWTLAISSLAGAAPEGDKPKHEPGALFERFDKNADQVLTADEVPAQVWAKLKQRDANQDGQVTREELRPKDGEARPTAEQMFQRLDKNQDQALTADEVPVPVWERISKADANADGKLTLDEAKAALAAREGGEGGKRHEQLFKQFDADQDGCLTQAEAPTEVWQRIAPADVNTDGKVSADELKALAEAGLADKGRPGKPGEGRPAGELFAKYDKNKDGALTQDEVPAEAWQRLSKADANQDGKITAAEFEAARAKGAAGQGGEGKGGDGKPGEGRTLADLFKKLDANTDGKVTAAEAGERWEKLSKLDRDGDGAVSLEEAKAAPK
ncbi:MAG: hypothetical protein IT204_24410 [Fimbriimonadaceae bacterium]|nr:hypothetical protein [Fimbriimonadaceae bacterium]